VANPAKRSAFLLLRGLRVAALALALVCVLTMVATQSAQAQTYSVLYTFAGGQAGGPIEAGLAIDRADNLYGVSFGGGTGTNCLLGCGFVFKLAKRGSSWALTPVYDFQGPPDGNWPIGVMIGPNGKLYGTTEGGGINNGETNCLPSTNGCGTVFELGPAKGGCRTNAVCPNKWVETVLYPFTGLNDDGGNPQTGNLLFDDSGNIYGTTSLGGASPQCGTVYEVSPSGGNWQETTLYSFDSGIAGFCSPHSGVVFDHAGDLYGTGAGVVYQLMPTGSGWTANVLHNFNSKTDGDGPANGVIFDAAGNLYGGTSSFGANGGGTVFELVASEDWILDTLYSFTNKSPFGGTGPAAGLTMDTAGNLYGATQNDGTYGWGNVFKLTPSRNGWIYTDLYDFTGGSDGGVPLGGVAIGGNGNLYGTTLQGGDLSECIFPAGSGCGVVWEIIP